MLTRLPSWQCSLANFLRDNQHHPFQYGSFDCCLFVCDAILAMTGTDVAAKFRGHYSTLREAHRFGSIRKITEQVTMEFGMPELPVVTLAQRGDVILIKRPRDYSLGIVDLTGMHIVVAYKDGLRSVPLSLASRAWRV